MYCTKCGANLPDDAQFCSSCGRGVASREGAGVPSAAPRTVEVNRDFPQLGVSRRNAAESSLGAPNANVEWRKRLLDIYLGYSGSQDLSEWLKDIGRDSSGTVDEKEARIREHTKYISMPAKEFPEQTLSYLAAMKKHGVLSEICTDLGLDSAGSNDARIRRIMREVGYQEGWLVRYHSGVPISREVVSPIIEWSPVLHDYDYEKDYYAEFADEMTEIFGSDNVHEQHPVAHGTTLKIDFHIGHPQKGGVGVEFKMPTNNSELQRALGQMDQYVSRYQSELIVVLYSKFLDDAKSQLFVEELEKKNIECIRI